MLTLGKKNHNSCQVNSCYNNKKNKSTIQLSHSFFKIPGSNRGEARKKWLEKINLTEEYLALTKLKKHHVCDRHFCKEDYALSGSFLRLNAVPTLNLINQPICPRFSSSPSVNNEPSLPSTYDFIDDNIECESIVSSSSYFGSDTVIENADLICNDFSNKFSNEFSNIEFPLLVEVDKYHSSQTEENDFAVCSKFCIKSAENEKFYRKQNENLTLKLKNLKLKMKSYILKNRHLTKKVSKYNKRIKELNEFKKNDIFKKVDTLNHLNENEKSFVKLLLKTKFRYTLSDKFISQNIYYRSPSIYRYFKETLKIRLPNIKTVLSWSKIKFVKPDLNEEVDKIIINKIKTFSDRDKHAILIFDELAIKKSFVYNIVTDGIDGFEHIGTKKNPIAASEAGFFMLRGIFNNWRIPFCYYLSKNSIKGDNLKELILKYISYCKMTFNLKIVALVSDQGTPNQKAFKLLGVTRETPFFFDSENVKVYALYDYPHLFKSVRNTLLKTNFIFPDKILNEKVEASFGIIRAIYEDEKTKITKKIPKLTQQHIYPNNFDKMRVKFATQILSNTTAAAIRAVCNDINDNLFTDNDIVKFALPTSYFCDMFNKCFDCMNKLPIYNKEKCEKVGYMDAYDFLKNHMLEFLYSLEYKSDAKCINGLIQSINAILLIVDFFFETDSSLCFIYASRFNQDPLENMFSKIRANGGFNRHPNAHQVGKIFSKIICLKLVFNTANSNCENDEEFIINEDWNQLIEDCNSIHDINFSDKNVDSTNDVNNTIEIVDNEDIPVNLINNNSDFSNLHQLMKIL